MTTTAKPVYTSLADFPAYKALPDRVQTFAASVAGLDDYTYCASYVSESVTASCLAQWPAMSEQLLAHVATQDNIWYLDSLGTEDATSFLPSVSTLYSSWLGQEAVQALVTTVDRESWGEKVSKHQPLISYSQWDHNTA